MKWRNYGLWLSIASVLYMVMKDMGFQIDLTHWQTYVTALLGILVALGVISNPENGKGYFNARIPPSSPEEPNINIENTDLEEPEPLPQDNMFNEQDMNQYSSINDQSNQLNEPIPNSNTDTEEVSYIRRYPPNEK